MPIALPALAAAPAVLPAAQIAAPLRLAQAAVPPSRAAPPAAPAPARSATVEAIVVTGATAAVRTEIDRRSYSLGKDIAASSGSAADALRNVPSVSVDSQGVLALRGEANVTILVDGKPSAMFEGAGRADALQQFPADQIERVEVITNPSAAMNPDGSGGIINIVTKPSKGAGWTGGAYATAGSAGLKRAGLNFGYNSPKLTVTGSLAGNYQRNKSRQEEVRSTLAPGGGVLSDHSLDQINRSLSRGPTAKLTVGYAVTPKDQLTLNASLNRRLVRGEGFHRFEDRDAAGAVTGFQERLNTRRFAQTAISLTGSWRHSFDSDGHQLTLDLIGNDTDSPDRVLWTTLRAAPALAPFELVPDRERLRHGEAKLSYVRPLRDGAKFSAGYEFKHDDNHFDADLLRGDGLAALTPDPAYVNRYAFGQTINAGYATYERALGDLNLQAGLRVENTDLDIDEASSPRARPTYLRAYPSLHLAYKLDDGHKLTASYSRRVQRPPPILLNPRRIFGDPKIFQIGNPDLKPQDTDAFEAGYELRKDGATYLATVYHRRNRGEFSPIARDAGAGAYAVTFDNLGSSRSTGLELVANGKLAPKLGYSVNANLFHKEIKATSFGSPSARSAYNLVGRVNLDWQATPKDLLQVNAGAQGRQMFVQGTIAPIYTVNLGWRRKVTDTVTLTASVQDLFNGNKQHRRLASPTLDNDAMYRPVSRAVSLRLDYRFGAKPKTAASEPGFDYGAPASGL